MLKLVDALASTAIIAVGLAASLAILGAAPTRPQSSAALDLVRRADDCGLLLRLTREPPGSVLPEIYALKPSGSLVHLELLHANRTVAEFGDEVRCPRSHHEVPLFVNGTVAVLVVDVA